MFSDWIPMSNIATNPSFNWWNLYSLRTVLPSTVQWCTITPNIVYQYGHKNGPGWKCFIDYCFCLFYLNVCDLNIQFTWPPHCHQSLLQTHWCTQLSSLLFGSPPKCRDSIPYSLSSTSDEFQSEEFAANYFNNDMKSMFLLFIDWGYPNYFLE